MTSQGNLYLHAGTWRNVGLYTSNEWPSSSSYSDVGSLNLPDIILRYLMILNEGCIT